MYETTNEGKIDGQMNIDQLAGKVENKSSNSQPSSTQTSTPTVNTASKPVAKGQKGKNKRTFSRNEYESRVPGELFVITRSKDMVNYVMMVTANSPKHFRYTLIARMHSLCIDLVENLYNANSCIIRAGDTANLEKRLEYQRQAMNVIRLIVYVSEIAYMQKCILQKHYSMISKYGGECADLLKKWVQSDERRVSST